MNKLFSKDTLLSIEKTKQASKTFETTIKEFQSATGRNSMTRENLQKVLDALIYHVAQTRPIQSTAEAIEILQTELDRHRPVVVYKTTGVGMSTVEDMPEVI